MFEKVNHIELSGEAYPIRCDMAVLEKIQDKYGDLIAFEDLIYKFEPKLDDKGKPVKNKEGLIIGTYGYPKISAVNDALYWFVEEGLDIEEPGKTISRKELIRNVDLPPIDLARMVHDEYVRCFERKNAQTPQNPETKSGEISE